MFNSIASLSLSIVLSIGMIPFTTEHDESIEENQYGESTIYNNGSSELMSITSSKSITYIDRNVSSKTLAYQFPRYDFVSMLNACACLAGANVLGYYDRYDENLIENHTAGKKVFEGVYVYNLQDDAVTNVVNKLYELMGTEDNGTTKTQFVSGMQKFCQDKGKSIKFSSCMKSNKFDFSIAKSYLQNNQPIVLFLSGYNVASIVESSNKDTINYIESTANHIMVGFGYKEYTYSTSSGDVTYNYFSVATGLIEKSTGLFDINYKTKINEAYAINIY